MTLELDWQNIFAECRANIQKAIEPCLKPCDEPQPDLGIGAGGDLMKPVDLASESAIIETLKKHEVSFTLISEETGVKKFGAASEGCYIITDPIDGTTNLTRRLPFYCTSIAVSSTPYLKGVYAGMVADLVHDQTFMAFTGRGAFCNRKHIQTSNIKRLEEACVGLDLGAYKTGLDLDCKKIIQNIKHTRHFGANALEICYVASGITDGFIDLRSKIRTTDVAAGFLIAKEAGATITDQANRPINIALDPKQTLNFIASANSEIHKQILSLINSDA